MTRKPPHERPSAGQLQNDTSGGDLWACPGCGCRMWNIVNSHEYGGPRKRQRVCRSCGEPLRTLEVPVPDGFTVAIIPEEEEA